MGEVVYLKKTIIFKFRNNIVQCQPSNYIIGTDDSFINELKTLFDKFGIKCITTKHAEVDGQLTLNIGYIGDETFSIDGAVIK